MTDQPSDMRETILARATGLFVARGYDGISIREIADACGLSKAGLYYHFKDKEALFLAILDRHLGAISEIVGRIEMGAGNARIKITAFIRAVFEELPPDRRAVIRLATQDMSKINPEARADFGRRYFTEFIHPLERILQKGMAAGEIRQFDLPAGVWALLGIMYPFLPPTDPAPEGNGGQTAGFLAGIFFDGVTV